MTVLPLYVWITQLLALAGFVATLLAVLAVGARTTGASRGGVAALVTVGAAALAAWAVATGALATAGVYRQTPGQPVPWIGVALAAVVVASLLVTRLPIIRTALVERGPALLAWPQVWRVLGVLFLVLMLTGDLPPAFAIPAGLGDIAIGISAPFIARRLAAGDRRGAVAFNVLGLLDLAVAVALGVLAAPGPLHLLQVSPSTEQLSLLPLALIPTVVVPICIALHIVSLRRLAAPPVARSGSFAPTQPRTPEATAGRIVAGE